MKLMFVVGLIVLVSIVGLQQKGECGKSSHDNEDDPVCRDDTRRERSGFRRLLYPSEANSPPSKLPLCC
ncbi:hypothetical protein J1N35_044219 [Gossypium stocksii]|uniref:Uncharacterized protein n=1 Tax=Gossypium stocksii TaxID=47602 RepID=A0A9D3ZFS9_9ROSI|nr:hypothetical protein J1N35_044219 [Gossypium stocksii]